MKRFGTFLRGGLLLCLLLGLGCGGGSSPTLYPVSGKVTVDGAPLTGGNVTYVPFEGEQNVGKLTNGQIDSNGNYTVSTDGRSGAPAGTFHAVVTPVMMPSGNSKAPPMPFNKKYREAKTTTMSIEVVPNAAPGAYDLKLTK
jgi:hypothetical protein